MAVNREQVVQWGETQYSPNFMKMNIKYMTAFATLARADLEATIAEQAKEIAEIKGSMAYRNSLCCRIEAERDQLRQQLQASQALEAQFRSGYMRISESSDLEMQDGDLARDIAEEAIAIPSDDTALREYGAKLVERIAEILYHGKRQSWLLEVADNIRKGQL